MKAEVEHGGEVEGGEVEGLILLLLAGLLPGEDLDAGVHDGRRSRYGERRWGTLKDVFVESRYELNHIEKVLCKGVGVR